VVVAVEDLLGVAVGVVRAGELPDDDGLVWSTACQKCIKNWGIKAMHTTRRGQDHVRVFGGSCDCGDPSFVARKRAQETELFSHDDVESDKLDVSTTIVNSHYSHALLLFAITLRATVQLLTHVSHDHIPIRCATTTETVCDRDGVPQECNLWRFPTCLLLISWRNLTMSITPLSYPLTASMFYDVSGPTDLDWLFHFQLPPRLIISSSFHHYSSPCPRDNYLKFTRRSPRHAASFIPEHPPTFLKTPCGSACMCLIVKSDRSACCDLCL
jgi:hypothetical protein